MAFDFDDLEEQDPAIDPREPVFVAWYSGGFHREEGEALVADLLQSVKAEFPAVATLVLHFPNEYNMAGEGSDPWPDYVDHLLAEIDKEPSRAGRSLLLFGHSRGNAPAMSVAARLQDRVKKVFIAGSAGPEVGKPSPFQTLSEGFKKTGDIGLLTWFVSLQPGNKMLEGMLEEVKGERMKVEDSKFLNGKITLMRQQYKDAMWPDMERDFRGVTAPIVAFGPRLDPGCPLEAMERWKQWTSDPEHSRVKMLSSVGHVDCLKKVNVDGVETCVLIEEVLREIAMVRAALGL